MGLSNKKHSCPKCKEPVHHEYSGSKASWVDHNRRNGKKCAQSGKKVWFVRTRYVK